MYREDVSTHAVLLLLPQKKKKKKKKKKKMMMRQLSDPQWQVMKKIFSEFFVRGTDDLRSSRRCPKQLLHAHPHLTQF